MSEFGRWLREWRTSRGVSQTGAAKAMRVSLRSVQLWERGDRIPSTLTTILDVARGTGTSPTSIFEMLVRDANNDAP